MENFGHTLGFEIMCCIFFGCVYRCEGDNFNLWFLVQKLDLLVGLICTVTVMQYLSMVFVILWELLYKSKSASSVLKHTGSYQAWESGGLSHICSVYMLQVQILHVR